MPLPHPPPISLGSTRQASSGILKSVDGGDHWVIKSKGIFDTRVVSLGIVDMDGNGDHVRPLHPATKILLTTRASSINSPTRQRVLLAQVYAGVPGKIYETTDGGETWMLLNTTVPLGTCYTFKNGTIGGEKYTLASW